MAGGKVKQTVETKFTTKGAKQTAKATESIGRAQTRLGQASASSGRQFSAQASGLGGLVAAYAGAAANIFAITMAFSALSRAAEAEQTIQGTRQLAAEIGQSGDAIIATIQKITRGQLSIAEAAQNANIALSAGFSTTQIERLNKAALKTSIALGRNLTDALTRLIRGTAKVEPELLDELGIFVRLDKAVQAYADEVGKSVGSLTQFERSQAFLNATLEQAESKFASISTEIESPIASFERLSAQIQDLGQQMGALLAQVMVPFVDFISGNFSNVLATFGLLAGIIFAKLGSVIRTKILSSTASIALFSDTMVTKLAGASAVSSTAIAGINSSLTGLDLRTVKGTRATQKAAREMLNLGKSASLTTAQLLGLQKVLRQQHKQGLPNLELAITRVDAALKKTNVTAKLAGIAFSTLGKAARGIGAGLIGILRFAGYFGIIVAGLQLISSVIAKIFGHDLFKEAGDAAQAWFKSLGKNFAAEKAAAASASEAVRGNIEALKEMRQEIDALIETKRGLANTDAAASKVVMDAKKAEALQLTQVEKVLRSIGRLQQKIADEEAKGRRGTRKLPAGIAGQMKFIEEKTGQKFDPRTIDVTKDDFMSALAQAFDKSDAVGDKKIGAAITKRVIAGAQNIDQKALADKITPVIEEIYKQSGRSAEAPEAFRFLDDTMAQIRMGKEGPMVAVEDLKRTAKPLTNLILNLKKLAAGYKSGNMTSSQMMKIQEGLRTSMTQLSDDFEEMGTHMLFFNKEMEKAKHMVEFTAAIETQTKTFRKMQGSLITSGRALEKFFAVSGEGPKLLFREQDIRANNLELMRKHLKATTDEGGAQETNADTLAAIAGLYKKIANDTAKLEINIKKQENSLSGQERILIHQLFLTGQQGKLKNLRASHKLEEATFKQEQAHHKTMDKILKAELGLEEKKNELAVVRLKIQRQESQARIEDFDRQTKRFEEQRNRQRDKAVAGLTQQQGVMGALPGLFTEGQGRQIEIQIAQENVNTLQDIFDFERLTLEKFEEEQAKNTKLQIDAIDKQITFFKKNIQTQKDMLLLQSQDARDEQTRIKERKKDLKAEMHQKADLLGHQLNIAKAQADIQHEAAVAQLKLQKIQVDMLAADAKMMQDHPKALSAVLLAHAESLKKTFTKGKGSLTKEERASFGVDITSGSEVFATLTDLQKKLGSAGGKDELGQPLVGTGLMGARDRIHQQQLKRANLIKDSGDKQLATEKKIANAKQDALKKQLDKEIDLNNIAIERLDIELKMAVAKSDADKVELTRTALRELEDKQAALAGRNAELQTARNELLNKSIQDRIKSDKALQIIQKISTQIGDRLGGSLTDLFTAMREGTLTTQNFKAGLKDLFVGVLADIQQTVLEETLINPLKDAVKEFFFGVAEPLINQTIVSVGGGKAVRVTMAGAAKGPVGLQGMDQETIAMLSKESPGLLEAITSGEIDLRGEMDDTIADLEGLSMSAQHTDSAFERLNMKVSESPGFFRNFFDGLKGAGSSLLDFGRSIVGSFSGSGGQSGSGILGFAESAVKGVGSFIGDLLFSSSGGIVRNMAAGGQMRDRVPAMLEPGEFVIRKPMAKAIGTPALNAMNSTGGIPNVEVVIRNEGTPQEATQAGTPRIDVDKMVVEIVTRDIRNNGPIRKTLRGEGTS